MVIIRTDRAGVHYGELAENQGQTVVLRNARRIWQWFGANTLNEVSTAGIDTARSRVSAPVERITLLDAIEIIPCSPAAQASIELARWGTG